MVAKESRFFIDKSQLHFPMCVRLVVGGFTYTMRVKNGQVEEEKINLGTVPPGHAMDMNVAKGKWVVCTKDEALGHLFPDRPAAGMEDAW